MNQYQWDGDIKTGAQWRLTVRPYLISRAPGMATILKRVEEQEDAGATMATLLKTDMGIHGADCLSLRRAIRSTHKGC